MDSGAGLDGGNLSRFGGEGKWFVALRHIPADMIICRSNADRVQIHLAFSDAANTGAS